MPMDTMDCWRMEGRAIRVMSHISPKEKRLVGPQLKFFRTRRNTTKDRRAESPWAIRVAQAAPATPRPNRPTITRSRAMLNSEEKIRKQRGILDFPSALNIEEITLYINRKGSPKK